MRIPAFILLTSLSVLRAQVGFSVDQFIPGQKILTVNIFDSLETLDLSRISVEGYDIENAVIFHEQKETFETVLSPLIIDLSHVPGMRTVAFIRERGELIIESTPDFVFEPGQILCDTAFGSFSRKIVQVLSYENRLSTLWWHIQVVPAAIQDIFLQCDISFSSRSSISYKPADTVLVSSISGLGPDSLETVSTLYMNLAGFQLHFNPYISGRLRVVQGQIEVYTFSLSGSYSTQGQIHTALSLPGTYHHAYPVPITAVHAVPFAPGINFRLAHHAEIAIDLQASDANFQASLPAGLHEDIQMEMVYSDGQWTALSSENEILSPGPSHAEAARSASQPGGMSVTVLPTVEILWGGENGLAVTPAFFSSMAESRNYMGSQNRTLAIGREAFFSPVSPAYPPAERSRSFSLGRFDRVLATPPIQLLNAVPQRAGADSIVLDWLHFPENGFVVIQMMINDTLRAIDSAFSPPAVIRNLEQMSEYTFRLIPVNAMGIGIPSVVTCSTIKRVFPPRIPDIFTPAFTGQADSAIRLSWRSADPDSGDILLYTLYLDTITPPSGIILSGQPDTSYIFRSLEPGRTYFWKVIVTDGRHAVDGPVGTFSTLPPETPSSRIPEEHRENFIFIPGGNFKRNSGNITISPFYIQKFEVTQQEFKRVTNKNPSFRKGDSLPVENVNWYDADGFCREIGGRLPTEAEWEYAARAGSNAGFPWQKEATGDYAWFHANADNRTHTVGSKKPNDWGLYDMSGNVFEWVQDWYGPYSGSEFFDPQGSPEGSAKVTRGGSWYSDPESLKPGARFRNRPAFSSFKLGFRCVLPGREEVFKDLER